MIEICYRFLGTPVAMRLEHVKLAFLGLLLMLSTQACASLGDGHPALVELSSKASEPVGRTIPVFIKVHCADHCGKQSVGLSRSEVFARDKSGQWVPTLRPREATELAGGTEPLLNAIGSPGGNAGFIASSAFQEAYPTNPGPLDFTGLSFLLSLVHAGYRTTHPEEVQMERVEAMSVPEQSGAKHFDGWVFFSAASYTEIKASYTWFADFSMRDRYTETLCAPWNGSSTSLDPAAKMEIAHEMLTQ
jgi:hypothetical protein